MLKHIIRFAVIIISSINSYTQPIQKEAFTIYTFTHRYDDKGKSFIENTPELKTIKLLGGYMIDPGKKGKINLQSVKKHLSRLYPDVNERSVLCVNIENKYYQDLKKKQKETEDYNKAIARLQELILTIKEFRPNVKIGVYGLPYRTYYPGQRKWNADDKLDPVLLMVDYFFPSLYILYPDKQKGEDANDAYWKMNLDQAFYYADKLGKPVIPFVWYMVTPGNKKYGGELLGKKEMKRYLNYIKEYTSTYNCKVKGVVWWESSKKGFEKNIKFPGHLKNDVSELNNSTILQEYTMDLLRN